MNEVLIFDAIRTARGKGRQGGSLASVPPLSLLQCLFEVLEQRNGRTVQEAESIHLGINTLIREQAGNLAKVAPLLAGWKGRYMTQVVSSFCISGLDALINAALRIQTCTEKLNLAGGVESMSRVPMFSDEGPWYSDPDLFQVAPFIHMAVSCDALANLAGLQRNEMDAYALRSHQRANYATEQAYFKSIIPIKNGEGIQVTTDELIRPDLNLDKLAVLETLFNAENGEKYLQILKKNYPKLEKMSYLHTKASAPGMADAASLLLLGSQSAEERFGLKARAKIRGFATQAADLLIQFDQASVAAQKALAVSGLAVLDVDLFEFNESFAGTVLKFQRDLDIPDEKLNVNGGAISMGHPLGATGGILCAMLLDELERQNKQFGLLGIVAAGGMNVMVVIERI